MRPWPYHAVVLQYRGGRWRRRVKNVHHDGGITWTKGKGQQKRQGEYNVVGGGGVTATMEKEEARLKRTNRTLQIIA